MPTLRDLREDRRLTQADLAETTRLNQATISHLELGIIKDPKTSTLRRIAEALQLPFTDILAAQAESIREAQEYAEAEKAAAKADRSRPSDEARRMRTHKREMKAALLLEQNSKE